MAALTRRNAARAELEAQRRLTQLREAPINRVWAGAEERLRNLVKQLAYRDVLKRCALRAARELGAMELALAADPVGHELLSAEILEQWSKEAGVQFRRATEPAATWGGLLATSGRLRFDATFPTQFALARVRCARTCFRYCRKEKLESNRRIKTYRRVDVDQRPSRQGAGCRAAQRARTSASGRSAPGRRSHRSRP